MSALLSVLASLASPLLLAATKKSAKKGALRRGAKKAGKKAPAKKSTRRPAAKKSGGSAPMGGDMMPEAPASENPM